MIKMMLKKIYIWIFLSIVKILKLKAIRLIFAKIDVLNKRNDLKFIKTLWYLCDMLSFNIKLNSVVPCVLEINGEMLFHVLIVFIFREAADNWGL